MPNNVLLVSVINHVISDAENSAFVTANWHQKTKQKHNN